MSCRIFSQWDQKNPWVDICPDCSLYQRDGTLREKNIARLKEILTNADALGMVVELEVFQHQSWREGNLGATEEERAKSVERALPLLARELLPYRNLTFQLWGEMTFRTVEYTKLIKATDPKRLVTNSPGGSGVLGTTQENLALDYLAPHTTRQSGGRHWEIVPREFDYLLSPFRKPVVDDEPARNGTPMFGGPSSKEPTYPWDQILQIYEVWKKGGYITYIHICSRRLWNASSIPPSGIPTGRV